MKHCLIFLLSCLPVVMFSQTILPSHKCLNKSDTSVWQVKHVPDSIQVSLCMRDGHLWVYAKYNDVNISSLTTTLGTYPCSCPYTFNEARICKVCLAHESRYINVRYQIATNPKSEYKELLETIKNE